jgi:hypothetical protein
VHSEESAATTVTCEGCRNTVILQIHTAVRAESAWRWFDCPHCRKPNFLRLPGHIESVHKTEQEV